MKAFLPKTFHRGVKPYIANVINDEKLSPLIIPFPRENNKTENKHLLKEQDMILKGN